MSAPTSPGRREHVSSGGPYEEPFGYSRAVRVGDRILVSGCTGTVDAGGRPLDGAGAQALRAIDVALQAVGDLGGALEDVVRTRMYVVDAADCEAVGRAHGTRLGGVRPAATMVVVAGLIDPAMLVEVELEAVVAAGGEQR